MLQPHFGCIAPANEAELFVGIDRRAAQRAERGHSKTTQKIPSRRPSRQYRLQYHRQSEQRGKTDQTASASVPRTDKGRDKSERQTHHRSAARGRSEEHTSELQSR